MPGPQVTRSKPLRRWIVGLLLLCGGLSIAVAGVATSPASADPSARLSGTVVYPGDKPAAGVEVDIDPAHPPAGQTFVASHAVTDAQGRWSYGPLASGDYELLFLVIGANGSRTTEATELVTLSDGQQATFSTTLSGPPGAGEGTLRVTLSTPGGFSPGAQIGILSEDGTGVEGGGDLGPGGVFTALLPAGRYALSPAGVDSDSVYFNADATVVAGEVTDADYDLPPLPVPPGTSAQGSDHDVGLLNAERARWGLPAGVAMNPVWSQACAAHNAYEQANKVLQHPEYSGELAYSPGGDWAGEHSILSVGVAWTPQANPWEDAPIHLNQLMTPDLSAVGIDESLGYACMTTWPGMLPPVAPAGTVLTYPGDGASGLPPAENAAERPFVPGQFIGIAPGSVAGRELFVYEVGTLARGGVSIASASLSSASGPVAIKWVDSSTPDLGPYLTGAIIVPVAPLAADTTYTGTVTLNADSEAGLAQVTHSWSFTTGPANPTGRWPGLQAAARGAPASRWEPTLTLASITLSHVRLSHTRFRVAAKRTAVAAGTSQGTTFLFHLSAAAGIYVTITGQSAGLYRGRTCVAPTAALRRLHAKRCVRIRAVGQLTRAREPKGSDRLPFSGRIGIRPLQPGRYRAVLVAGTLTSLSNRVGTAFTIVRPRAPRRRR